MKKICMISDTHEQWHDLTIPECDLLISAGDYSYRGESEIVQSFHRWLNDQPAKHIISVNGNHELWPEMDFEQARYLATSACPRVSFIGDGETVTVEGIKTYGSAITPAFNHWAWNVRRGEPMQACWAQIPDDTEILITHGPPQGILDVNHNPDDPRRAGFGCEDLLARIKQLSKLRLHVFGHIHGSSGEHDEGGVHFVNAAICNERYKPTNPVREFIWS